MRIHAEKVGRFKGDKKIHHDSSHFDADYDRQVDYQQREMVEKGEHRVKRTDHERDYEGVEADHSFKYPVNLEGVSACPVNIPAPEKRPEREPCHEGHYHGGKGVDGDPGHKPEHQAGQQ